MLKKDNKLGQNNRTSLAGEFYVMSRLLTEGYDATLTLGNTKGVDILVSNPRNKKLFRIEVKSTAIKPRKEKIFGTNYNWRMNEKHEDDTDPKLIYCFVQIKESKIFFVPSKDVSKYCKWEYKKWKNAERKRNVKDTKMRTFRINALKESKYENNFSLFE